MLYMRDIARVVPLNARPSHPRHHRLHHRIRNVNPPYAFPRIIFILVLHQARFPDWDSIPTVCKMYPKMIFMIFVPLATKILPLDLLSWIDARRQIHERIPLGVLSRMIETPFGHRR